MSDDRARYIAIRVGMFADGKGTPSYQIAKLRDNGGYALLGDGHYIFDARAGEAGLASSCELAPGRRDIRILQAAGHAHPSNAPVDLAKCLEKIDELLDPITFDGPEMMPLEDDDQESPSNLRSRHWYPSLEDDDLDPLETDPE